MNRKILLLSLLSSIAIMTGACTVGATLESTATGTASHNVGKDCITAGCHLGGSKAFTVAGTLYVDVAGSTIATGSIEVTSGADVYTIPVDTKGNFYTDYPFTFPVTVGVAGGNSMNASVSTGSCNTSGCHSAADNRIF